MSGLALTLTFDGHRVRMVGTPERPEWIARDVCRALSIHHTADALRNAGVTANERGSSRIDTPGGPQDVTTVTEPGLWKLVMASRKPSAIRFKTWIATDVLPSIRQHGAYPPPPERPALPAVDLDSPDSLRGLLEALTLRRLADAERIAVLEPLAESAHRLSEAHGDVSLSDAIRILGRSQKATLILWQADGLLFRGAHGKLIPTVEHRERGTFRVRVTEVDGDAYEQTLVTPKGLQWLAARYPADIVKGRLTAGSPDAGGPLAPVSH